MVGGTVAWLLRSAAAGRDVEVLRHVGAGLAHADSLERAWSGRSQSEITTADAVSALYLERLRLGLGSPFRLIDQALRDQDLEAAARRPLAEALLARTAQGKGYQTPTGALDLIESDPRQHRGRIHRALIDSVVASRANPRVGELAVRLAYRLASASGAVSRRAPEIATAAAAQARDRVLAMEDARALIDASDLSDVTRFTMLRVWRETHRFAVETPVILPLTAREERDAIERLPQLVTRVESIARGLADSSEAGPSARRGVGEPLARRMAVEAGRRDAPPLAPVTVAVAVYASLMSLPSGGVTSFARRRFVERATNEERIAAEYAVLGSRSLPPPAAGAAVLTAAVAMRPFAQERTWMQGDPAPTVRDLQARFGVAVTFDATTRAGWRPTILRNLGTAIEDLRTVLPAYDTRGLRVHVGDSPLGARALAMHDPITRTIYFPVGSSGGVMAHEFAHDLDWLAARQEYGGTGWYRTDHAVRQPSDVLAGTLRQMASAANELAPGRHGRDRPTEVFARNVDWFVAATLARVGRVNGSLSAVQDPVLTGYASAITPEAAREGGSATLRALDGMTMIPAPEHEWFAAQFGAERRLSVHEAVRQVLEAPAPRMELRRGPDLNSGVLPAAEAMFSGVPEVAGAWRCLLDRFSDRGTDAAAVRAVVLYSAEARARGVVRRWRELAERDPRAVPVKLRALTGAPWNPAIGSAVLGEVRDALLWSALVGAEPDLRNPNAGGSANLRAAWRC